MSQAIKHIKKQLAYLRVHRRSKQIKDALKFFSKTYATPTGPLTAAHNTVKNITPFLKYIKGGAKTILNNIWHPLDEWNSTQLKLWLDASTTDWKTGDTQEYLTFVQPDPFVARHYEVGNAIDVFQNDGYASLDSDIVLAGDFTVSFLFYGDPTVSPQMLMGETGNADTYLYFSANTTIRWRFNSGTNYVWSVPAMSNDTWHQLTFTRDGSNGRMWVDGVESTTGLLAINTNSISINLLGNHSTLTLGWEGKLDDFIFWDGVVATDANAISFWNGGVDFDRTTIITSPTSRYKFDEASGATILDSGSLGIDGTLQGSYSRSARGIYDNGKAMTFDGVDDYVQLDSITTLTGDFTVSFWMNPSAYAYVLRSSTDDRFHFNTGNTFLCYLGATSSTFGFTVTALNEWHHVVVTRSGTDLRCYIDDVESSSGALTTTAGNVEIDRISATATSFNGEIDDLVVWDGTVATAGNVTSLYNSGAGVDPTTVVASPTSWYKLNESPYSLTVTDSGSGANDGTLVNALKVSAFDDRSGNGNNIIQGTALNQPTITNDVFGTRTTKGIFRQHLELTSGADLGTMLNGTLVCLCSYSDVQQPDSSGIMDIGVDQSNRFRIIIAKSTGTISALYQLEGGSQIGSITGLVNGDKVFIIVRGSKPRVQVEINKIEVADLTPASHLDFTGTPDSIYFHKTREAGTNQSDESPIAEAFYIDEYITDDQVTLINDYFLAKHGV